MSKYALSFASSHENCELHSDNYLQINSCGMLKVAKKEGESHSRPPRIDYMLLYLYEGNSSTIINGQKINMNPGDLILLRPGSPLDFTFDYNSMHFWLHMTGSAVDDILKECGLNKTNLYKIGVSEKIWNLFTDIYFHQSFEGVGFLMQAKGLFLEMLGEIANILIPYQSEFKGKRSEKIYPALKKMTLNFAENHKIQYYAELCDMTLSNFHHSFTEITGSTPHQYITSIRVDVAKKYLSTTQDSIQKISDMVGYEDPLYFSRIFKKSVGISPKEYKIKTQKILLKHKNLM